jgi:hypothetical protein
LWSRERSERCLKCEREILWIAWRLMIVNALKGNHRLGAYHYRISVISDVITIDAKLSLHLKTPDQ